MNTDRGVNYLDYLAYGVVVCGSAAALLAMLFSRTGLNFVLWYGVIPMLCIFLHYLTKTRVVLDWREALADLRRYSRVLLIFGGIALVLAIPTAYSHWFAGSHPPFPLKWVISNVFEELIFRVTGITALELLERKLFKKANLTRVVLLTSGVFALAHLPGVLSVPFLHPWHKYVAAAIKVGLVFYIGTVLGGVYCRSRNAVSAVVFHWLINLQSLVANWVVFLLLTALFSR